MQLYGNVVRDKLASEYIFVRYMGPKFVIAFIGEGEDEVVKFIKRLKVDLETEEVKVYKENLKGKDEYVKPVINFALGTYYKATGLEKLTQKLEEYLDNAPEDESDINYI